MIPIRSRKRTRGSPLEGDRPKRGRAAQSESDINSEDGSAPSDDERMRDVNEDDFEDDEMADADSEQDPPEPAAARNDDPFASSEGESDGSLSEDSDEVRSDDDKDASSSRPALTGDALDNELVARVRGLPANDKINLLRALKLREKDEKEHKAWATKKIARSRARPSTKDRLLARLEPDFSDPNVWSQADEDRLKQKLQAKRYMDRLEGFVLPKKGHCLFRPTWHRIIGIKDYLPTQIIGQPTLLSYNATQPVHGYPDPIWSDKFCRNLSAVVLACPVDAPETVSILILWAVACRLNDRRQIPFNHGTTDLFLMRLGHELRHTDGRKSLPKIHKMVRHQIRADPNTSLGLPWISKVLRNVEKQVYDKDTAPSRGSGNEAAGEFSPFLVETQDLQAVRIALNSVRVAGVAALANVGNTARTFGKVRKYDANNFPHTDKDFQELLPRIWLWEQRCLEIRKKAGSIFLEPEFGETR
ncbi:hypothetical protein PG999_007488 [Apiospora kogelbergensis]|uniref:Uncharacterized protein n=1 Tax=Apiospora kogelbergensis TaxID=1337665 RepID=A0AAW0QYK3_9PEZI